MDFFVPKMYEFKNNKKASNQKIKAIMLNWLRY